MSTEACLDGLMKRLSYSKSLLIPCTVELTLASDWSILGGATHADIDQVVVRTIQYCLLLSSAVQVNNVHGKVSLSIAISCSNGTWKRMQNALSNENHVLPSVEWRGWHVRFYKCMFDSMHACIIIWVYNFLAKQKKLCAWSIGHVTSAFCEMG